MHCTAEKFVKFGVQFLALRNQFFDPGDLGVYVLPHHLLSPTLRYLVQRSPSYEIETIDRNTAILLISSQGRQIIPSWTSASNK